MFNRIPVLALNTKTWRMSWIKKSNNGHLFPTTQEQNHRFKILQKP